MKTLLQLAIFWTTFLVVLPWGILWLETQFGLEFWRFPGLIPTTIGIVLFCLAGSLGLTCGITMAMVGRGTPMPTDCARELVVVGPYRYVRNPMAIAGLSQGVAVGIFLGSPAVILYALAGGPVWHVLVRPWEELDLEQRFGESYRCYRASVRCWLPRFW
ncbi:MAG: methyltransferase family protein [Fimbriiglobus sp.]